jgi:hypothetical protein
MVDGTDTDDIFKMEDGGNSKDNDLLDLQEVSDDEDDDNVDEVEAAYQRTKAFGDTDRDIVLLLCVYYQ